MARPIKRDHGSGAAATSAPALVDGVEAVPADLLPLNDLPRTEYAERRSLRRQWFRARGIENDWNARRRAVSAGFTAAGIAEPDPREFLRAAFEEAPSTASDPRRRGARKGGA